MVYYIQHNTLTNYNNNKQTPLPTNLLIVLPKSTTEVVILLLLRLLISKALQDNTEEDLEYQLGIDHPPSVWSFNRSAIFWGPDAEKPVFWMSLVHWCGWGWNSSVLLMTYRRSYNFANCGWGMCVADTPIEKKRYHLIKLKIQPHTSRGPWCVQILASLRSARIL